jgi:hypothetical protein
MCVYHEMCLSIYPLGVLDVKTSVTVGRVGKQRGWSPLGKIILTYTHLIVNCFTSNFNVAARKAEKAAAAEKAKVSQYVTRKAFI